MEMHAVHPNKPRSEASLTTVDVGVLPSDDDYSMDVKKMKIIHGEVEEYLKQSIGYGKYKEFHESLNVKGSWGNYLRAMIDAKRAKWNREKEGGRDACFYPPLADEGLTVGDITNVRTYFSKYLAKFPSGKEDWSHEFKMDGAYGAYIRAICRINSKIIFEILAEMKKEISLPILAIMTTKISYLEVYQFLLERFKPSKKQPISSS